MSGFGAFSPFGLLQFGSTESFAEPIYRSMKGNVDGGLLVEEGGHTEASIYARAIACGSVRVTVRHGFSQRRPKRAVEFLPALERQFGLVPGRDESLDERRAAVAARKRIARGSRRENLENSLRTLLGAAYVGLRVEPAATTPGLFPASPGNVGAWDSPVTLARFFRLVDAVSFITTATVRYENVLADGALVGVGERFCVEPENASNAEAVTVLAATTTAPFTMTAAFTRSHDVGGIFRSHAPAWQSFRRSVTVVVTHPAALDAAVRRRIDALMRRIVRGTTIWSIAYPSATATLGPFTVGSSEIGLVPIGVVTY